MSVMTQFEFLHHADRHKKDFNDNGSQIPLTLSLGLDKKLETNIVLNVKNIRRSSRSLFIQEFTAPHF